MHRLEVFPSVGIYNILWNCILYSAKIVICLWNNIQFKENFKSQHLNITLKSKCPLGFSFFMLHEKIAGDTCALRLAVVAALKEHVPTDYAIQEQFTLVSNLADAPPHEVN